MPRKVFISILGVGFYQKATYGKDKYKSQELRFIQEATLEMLDAKNWQKPDTALILLTKKARNDNWDKSIENRTNFKSKTEEKYIGLEQRLLSKKYNLKLQGINIPNGNNEDEIWEIFETLYEKIETGDELYIDITHSFRYLPMLLIVFCNYAKFLKQAEVKSITYGNFEAKDPSTNVCPIIDLLPISALQDWTFATANFLDNGSVKHLVDLSNTELNPILKEFKGQNEDANKLRKFVGTIDEIINQRITCRGIDIIESKELKNIKDTITKLNNIIIPPLKPVIEKIDESIAKFDTNENINNGFYAAKWCYDNRLYQQSITILFENIVTYICNKYDYNWRVEACRSIISAAFNIQTPNIDTKEKEDWEKNNCCLHEKLQADEEFKELSKIHNSLRDFRNDYNHSGMRNAPSKHTRIIQRIGEQIKEVFELLKL